MRVDFKVSYYLRTNYLNKKGEAAIMVRLNLNSERLTVGASGFSVRPDLWDNLRMCVKGKTAEARNLNLELDEINMRLRTFGGAPYRSLMKSLPISIFQYILAASPSRFVESPLFTFE